MDRRTILRGALLGAGGGLAGAAAAQVPYYSVAPENPTVPPAPVSSDTWQIVRAAFDLDPDYVDLSAMLLASHPRAVREAIDRYRTALDRQPVLALKDNKDRQNAGRSAVARYLGCGRDQIALTDSTASAVALVYNGLKLNSGDEILTVRQDYYVTHEAARYAAAKRGATVRRVSLHEGGSRGARADAWSTGSFPPSGPKRACSG